MGAVLGRPQRPPPPTEFDDTILLDLVRIQETSVTFLRHERVFLSHHHSRFWAVSHPQPNLARIVLPNDSPTFHCSLNGRNRWQVYDVYEKPEPQVRACVRSVPFACRWMRTLFFPCLIFSAFALLLLQFISRRNWGAELLVRCTCRRTGSPTEELRGGIR